MVILDLFKVYFQDKKRFIGINRDKNFYSKAILAARYNSNECTYRLLVDVLDTLNKRKMIEEIKRSEFSGRVSRIRMRKVLFKYYEKGTSTLKENQIE
mgnify:CR=1